MKVIFLHGKESGPDGCKATLLRERFGALTPDLYGKPLAEQAEIAARLIEANPDCLVVGSSMGGAVAVLASQVVAPKQLLLLAPALHYPEVRGLLRRDIPTSIIHGVNDDVVPCTVSMRESERVGCGLALVEDGHRLMDSKSLILRTIEQALKL